MPYGHIGSGDLLHTNALRPHRRRGVCRLATLDVVDKPCACRRCWCENSGGGQLSAMLLSVTLPPAACRKGGGAAHHHVAFLPRGRFIGIVIIPRKSYLEQASTHCSEAFVVTDQ